MASSPVFLLFSFLSLLFVEALSAETAAIRLPLRHFRVSSSTTPPPSMQWRQTLAGVASSSLVRARHLKSPGLAPLPLNPHSYGGYSVSLGFGTPPQKTSLIMDTGSDLVWIPCTRSYLCRNCSFPAKSNRITPFIPKSSSSSRIIGCKNPKCGWIHRPEFLSGTCRSCNSGNCTQICPPYFVLYGSGSTGGVLLSETLSLIPGKGMPNFAVGCSVVSSRQPAGIAGLGRGSPSLPAQLGAKRLSYCLVSHRFDDDPRAAGALVLNGEHKNLSYTPLVKNPATGNPSFAVFYYVALRKISVGGKSVKIPYERLRLGPDGNGGTIVDSGTTFTYMAGHVYDPVARAFETQVGRTYRRATEVETVTGLRPCFHLPTDTKSPARLPELTFHFKGGAKMRLPAANYFSFLGDSVICLTVVSDGVEGSLLSGGPSIILGNYQQQNFLIEYDLEKERFGFREQKCDEESS